MPIAFTTMNLSNWRLENPPMRGNAPACRDSSVSGDSGFTLRWLSAIGFSDSNLTSPRCKLMRQRETRGFSI